MKDRSAYPLAAVAVCLGLLLPAATAHADEPQGVRQACTIVGTAEDDVLQGTEGTDVICGLAGDDVIAGMAGDDVLRGGPGDDVLVGGLGRDRLYGSQGDDRLVDNRGPSTENGGPGTDLCVAVNGSVVSGCERTYITSGTGA